MYLSPMEETSLSPLSTNPGKRLNLMLTFVKSPIPSSVMLQKEPVRAHQAPSPPPTQVNKRVLLGKVIRVAAIKNAAFQKEPKRSGSLLQSLLQRRLWFSLVNDLK